MPILKPILTPEEAEHALDLVKLGHKLAKAVLNAQGEGLIGQGWAETEQIIQLANDFMNKPGVNPSTWSGKFKIGEGEKPKLPPMPDKITIGAEDTVNLLRARVGAKRTEIAQKVTLVQQDKLSVEKSGSSGLDAYKVLEKTHGKFASIAYGRGVLAGLDATLVLFNKLTKEGVTDDEQ